MTALDHTLAGTILLILSIYVLKMMFPLAALVILFGAGAFFLVAILKKQGL